MKRKAYIPSWFSHVIWLPALLVLVFSGLRISASREDGLALQLAALLPDGEVHQWHYWAAFAFIFSTLYYLVYLLISSKKENDGKKARMYVKTGWWQKLSGWFKASHWVGLALLIGNCIVGSLLMFVPSADVIEIHLLMCWAFIGYLVVHTLLALVSRGWLNSLRVFIPYSKSFGLLYALSAAVLVYVSYFVETFNTDTLVLEQHNQSIDLDGEARESVWQTIAPNIVSTRNGSQQTSVDVSIRAFHDGESGYFLFQWPDATRSLKHLPLIKTEDGWKVVQTSAKNADENRYYEDKLAIMLSRSNQFAGAGTTHLGKKPLKHHPQSSGGRGLHYTTDGSYTDVWHWKAVRTGLSLGQADDNFFGSPSPSDSEYKRYTGGYQKDPDCEHLVRYEAGDFHVKPECGGFVMNWAIYSDDTVQPKRLPADPSFIKKMGNTDLNSEQSDYGRWWMKWEETIPYHPDHDPYPIGTVIPSVITLGPFSKGRGDVSTEASWNNGMWTLEVKRSLSVDNQYDLPIENGIYLWIAAFDHSQTRHSYSLRPLKIELH